MVSGETRLKLVPGTLIAGKFRLEESLAQGGMGAVFRAVHVQLRANVAIKFMSPTAASSAAALARFEREARAAAQLQHLNIVGVQDFGIEEGTPYIVMEYLRGESLEQRLVRKTRFSLTVLTPIVTQIAKGLRKAHEAGVIHRDLKPGNIFLAMTDEDEETVKILDFGIAKDTAISVDSGTKTGEFIGSPHYMSPEQIQDAREIDHRSDLWSLGVIVYRCITGVLPFPGDTLGAILGRVLTAPTPPPSKYVPKLKPGVDAFFVRALARDREQRFQSAIEFAEAFAALSGMEATVRKPTMAPWSGQDSALLRRDFQLPAEGAQTTQTGAAAASQTHAPAAYPSQLPPAPAAPPAYGTGSYPVAPAASAEPAGTAQPPPVNGLSTPLMQTIPLQAKAGKTIKMKPLSGPAPDPGPPRDFAPPPFLPPSHTVPLSTPIAQVNPGTLTVSPSAGDAGAAQNMGVQAKANSLLEQWKGVPFPLRVAAIVGLSVFFIVLIAVFITSSGKTPEPSAELSGSTADSAGAGSASVPSAGNTGLPVPEGPASSAEPAQAGAVEQGGEQPASGSTAGQGQGEEAPKTGPTGPKTASGSGKDNEKVEPAPAKTGTDQSVIAIRAKGGSCKTVSVKGKTLGSTPINLNVAPGNYTVYCRTDKGATKSGSVSVGPGESKSIVFNLK